MGPYLLVFLWAECGVVSPLLKAMVLPGRTWLVGCDSFRIVHCGIYGGFCAVGLQRWLREAEPCL